MWAIAVESCWAWQLRVYILVYILCCWISTIIIMQAVNPGEGREYSKNDDKGPKDLLIRSKKGLFLTPAYAQGLQQAYPIFGNAAFLLQTKDGSLLVAGSQNRFIIYNISKRALLLEEDCNYIYSMTLSPSQQYLQILDKVDASEGKTIIISLDSLKKVAVFKENAQSNYYVKSSYPLIKFTSDDRLMFRYNCKTIEVYDWDCKQVRVIKAGVQEFLQPSVISTQQNYLVATAYLDRKTNKGCLQLYSHEKDQPVYEKTINKAEQIIIKFSPTSNKFLIMLQTYYDPTGKSYYGEYGLYLYNDELQKISKIKTASGPVHDFSWNKKGNQFLVISGFMPAEPVLFSDQNQVLHEFGKQHKNHIIWGNLGRFVCLAGFGNLNGQMDIWDLEQKTKVGACKSNSSSYCGWSTDDRKLITAILTPRLRVDNCYKIFSYTGVQLHKANFDDTELYEAVWLKNNQFSEKDARGLSPGRKSGEAKQEAKFKSFGASLDFDALKTAAYVPPNKQEGPKLAPGQHPPEPKKKKRNRHNKNEPKLQA